MQRFERDPALLDQYEIDVLPLSQLSTQEAADLVVKHVTNHTRFRKSRLRKH